MCNHQKLRFAGIGFHKVCKQHQVFLIQRRLNLIQNAKRCGPHFQHRKQQRNGRQRPLSAGKQRDIPRLFARRLRHDLNIAGKRVVFVLQNQFGVAPAKQQRENALKVLVDLFKALQKLRLHLLCQFFYHALQILARLV